YGLCYLVEDMVLASAGFRKLSASLFVLALAFSAIGIFDSSRALWANYVSWQSVRLEMENPARYGNVIKIPQQFPCSEYTWYFDNDNPELALKQIRQYYDVPDSVRMVFTPSREVCPI
ncbi:MAG: hypothetical protein E6167_03455, partial [Varibaculum cambriense]|nr:hypothetical protein [Varibaculum cambriense]